MGEEVKINFTHARDFYLLHIHFTLNGKDRQFALCHVKINSMLTMYMYMYMYMYVCQILTIDGTTVHCNELHCMDVDVLELNYMYKSVWNGIMYEWELWMCCQ